MAETLLQYQTAVTAPDGTVYRARACGSPMEGGNWQGWIEFDPIGPGEPLRSSRETTQPNRVDTEYWATGLTHVYLEGSLQRALKPLVTGHSPAADPARFGGPASGVQSVLDPFSVYQKGETLLRRQLGALSAWHLVNIAIDYELTAEDRATLSRLPAAALVDRIVKGVQGATESRGVTARRR
jgi:hypothetical protein